MKDPTTTIDGLSTCETLAAIVVHVRQLGPKGLCYSGGADTKTLCGAEASWDSRIPIEGVTCRTCMKQTIVALRELIARVRSSVRAGEHESTDEACQRVFANMMTLAGEKNTCSCCRRCGATVPCPESCASEPCAGRCFCGVQEAGG